MNKSPLKTSGTVAIGLCAVRESCTFSGHPYIGRITRLSLRQHGFLVRYYHYQTVTIRHKDIYHRRLSIYSIYNNCCIYLSDIFFPFNRCVNYCQLQMQVTGVSLAKAIIPCTITMPASMCDCLPQTFVLGRHYVEDF